MIKTFNVDSLLTRDAKPFVERDPSTETDQAGFIPADVQINRFIKAGVRLTAARREEYEFPDGNVPDDVRPDPTEELGFDLADASAIMQGLQPVLADEPAAERSGAAAQSANDSAESQATEA